MHSALYGCTVSTSIYTTFSPSWCPYVAGERLDHTSEFYWNTHPPGKIERINAGSFQRASLAFSLLLRPPCVNIACVDNASSNLKVHFESSHGKSFRRSIISENAASEPPADLIPIFLHQSAALRAKSFCRYVASLVSEQTKHISLSWHQ